MKTAGVVVTYNRKEELVKNIRAILSQSYVVDRYYIIDNHSSDNTEQLLKEEGILDNQVIEYVYLKENIGGSGGFYTGLKMAYPAPALLLPHPVQLLTLPLLYSPFSALQHHFLQYASFHKKEK